MTHWLRASAMMFIVAAGAFGDAHLIGMSAACLVCAVFATIWALAS